MAKKASSDSSRTDPRENKSLAIRTMIDRMPKAKASEIAAGVKKEFGHDVKQNMVYMVKTKLNMKANRKRRGRPPGARATVRSLQPQWVEAIKIGRQLLQATGSAANATALLKAIEA